MRRRLHCAGDRDERHRLPPLREEARCHAREDRRDACALGEVVEGTDPALFAGRDDESAAAEAEVELRDEAAVSLLDEVPPGDSRVGGAVGDELRDVLGADEDPFELAAEGGDEGPVRGGPDLEPGVGEEGAGVIVETALVGDGEAEHRRIW